MSFTVVGRGVHIKTHVHQILGCAKMGQRRGRSPSKCLTPARWFGCAAEPLIGRAWGATFGRCNGSTPGSKPAGIRFDS